MFTVASCLVVELVLALGLALDLASGRYVVMQCICICASLGCYCHIAFVLYLTCEKITSNFMRLLSFGIFLLF